MKVLLKGGIRVAGYQIALDVRRQFDPVTGTLSNGVLTTGVTGYRVLYCTLRSSGSNGDFLELDLNVRRQKVPVTGTCTRI